MLTLALACADASFVLPQYPVCCPREIFSHKIGLHGPPRLVPGEFTFTVAGSDENAARTRVSRKFHVAITIANHKGALQIERVLASCAIQHARFRLSAVTVFSVCMQA